MHVLMNMPHAMNVIIHKPHAITTEEKFLNLLMVAAGSDRKLSKEELHEVLRDLGLHFKWLKVWLGMKHADLNHNHLIDGDKEFNELVDYARRRWGVIRKSPQ